MIMTGTGETIVQEITINAPASRVFEALTNPEQRKAWWGSAGRFQTTHMDSDLRSPTTPCAARDWSAPQRCAWLAL